MRKLIAGAGFILLMLGAAAADSEQIVIPALMMLLGLAGYGIGARTER